MGFLRDIHLPWRHYEEAAPLCYVDVLFGLPTAGTAEAGGEKGAGGDMHRGTVQRGEQWPRHLNLDEPMNMPPHPSVYPDRHLKNAWEYLKEIQGSVTRSQR